MSIFPYTVQNANPITKEALGTLQREGRWVAEPKYDGDRRLWVIDREPKLYGRRISKTTGDYVEKIENVPHFQLKRVRELRDTILDGEMLCAGNPLQCKSPQVTSIMGSNPDRAIALQEERGKMQMVVFDCLRYCGKDLLSLPLSERIKYAEAAVQHILEQEYIEDECLSLVPRAVKGFPFEDYYHMIVSEGGEGIMVKRTDARYFMDARPAGVWYKLKKVATFDVVIIGFEAAKSSSVKKGDVRETVTKYSGQIGAAVFGFTAPKRHPAAKLMRFPDGQVLPIIEAGTCSGFDDATRLAMSKKPESYLGRVIEVAAQEPSGTGSFRLRHPRFKGFRDDKTAGRGTDITQIG